MDQSLKPFQGQATRRIARPDRCGRVALVLQAGDALGAYQAGVYRAASTGPADTKTRRGR